jgi:hypothetical protein
MELFQSLRIKGWPAFLAAALFLYCFVLFMPRMLRQGAQQPPQTQFIASLESDLDALGGASVLQEKVQCFDLVYGCLNALYHQKIVENTGFTGDMLFFSPQPSLAREFYRDRFWTLARQDPASVLVVSNQTPFEANSFGKLTFWPEFQAYLAANYVLAVERGFPEERFTVHREGAPFGTDERDSYRLYLRKGSPLLARIPELTSRSGS